MEEDRLLNVMELYTLAVHANVFSCVHSLVERDVT